MTYHRDLGQTLIARDGYFGRGLNGLGASDYTHIDHGIYWTKKSGTGPDGQPSQCWDSTKNKYANNALCANSGKPNPYIGGSGGGILSAISSIFAPQSYGAGMPGMYQAGMPGMYQQQSSWVMPVVLAGVGITALVLLTRKKGKSE